MTSNWHQQHLFCVKKLWCIEFSCVTCAKHEHIQQSPGEVRKDKQHCLMVHLWTGHVVQCAAFSPFTAWFKVCTRTNTHSTITGCSWQLTLHTANAQCMQHSMFCSHARHARSIACDFVTSCVLNFDQVPKPHPNLTGLLDKKNRMQACWGTAS